jgi:hypothetical protein
MSALRATEFPSRRLAGRGKRARYLPEDSKRRSVLTGVVSSEIEAAIKADEIQQLPSNNRSPEVLPVNKKPL